MPSNKAVLGVGRTKGGAARKMRTELTGYLADAILSDGMKPQWFERLGLPSNSDLLPTALPGQRRRTLRALLGIQITKTTKSIAESVADALETTPSDVVQKGMTRHYLQSDCPMKLVPLKGAGGSVRVATIHDVDEVQLARALTTRWLSSAKNWHSLRGIGKARRDKDVEDNSGTHSVTVSWTHDGDRPNLDWVPKAFSADLSKATDYMPHELSQAVGLILLLKDQDPDALMQLEVRYSSMNEVKDPLLTTDDILAFVSPKLMEQAEVIMKLFGTKQLDVSRYFDRTNDEEVTLTDKELASLQLIRDSVQTVTDGQGSAKQIVMTTNGVHMGLGPSWILLCFINGFAAWDARAPKESYAICGDDLIGAWPPFIRDRYDANLRACALVVNKTKSGYGIRGTFCEQLVEPTSVTIKGGKKIWTWKSRDVGHLSQEAGTVFFSKPSKDKRLTALLTADALAKGVKTPLSRKTFRKVLPLKPGLVAKLKPGCITVGGSGDGPPELGGIISYLRGKQLMSRNRLPPLVRARMNDVMSEATEVAQELHQLATPQQKRLMVQNHQLIDLDDAIIQIQTAYASSRRGKGECASASTQPKVRQYHSLIKKNKPLSKKVFMNELDLRTLAIGRNRHRIIANLVKKSERSLNSKNTRRRLWSLLQQKDPTYVSATVVDRFVEELWCPWIPRRSLKKAVGNTAIVHPPGVGEDAAS